MSADPYRRAPGSALAESLSLPERRAARERDLVKAVMEVGDLMRDWGVYVVESKAAKPIDVRWMLAPLVSRLMELERQVERQGRDQDALAKLIAPDLERVCEPMAQPAPVVIAGQPPGPPIARPRWHRPGKR